MSAAGSRDALGLAGGQIVDDGEIVRRQVPDDVDVVLEKAQIDPHGVVIVELPERTVIDHLPDTPHGAGKEEGVIHHDLEVLLLSQLNQLLGLHGSRGKRLLHEYVLAVLESGFGQLKVCPDGRHDGDGVDAGRG